MARLGFWTEEEKLAALLTSLSKRPKMFYHRLPPEAKATYKMAIDEIQTMFDAREDTSILRRELHTIKQGDSSVMEYLERIEYLFTELEVHPNAQLDYLTAGLRPDLQDYVYLKQPLSCNAAVKALKLKVSIKRDKPSDARLAAITDELTNWSLLKKG